MGTPISHLGLSLLAGSLTTLSPCVFPILPMVSGPRLRAFGKGALSELVDAVSQNLHNPLSGVRRFD